jgi:hypothetical protein
MYNSVVTRHKAQPNIPTEELMSMDVRLDGFDVVKDGECMVCRKRATEAHVASVAHMMKTEQHCIATLMAGRSQGGRRFESNVGMTALCVQANVMRFWGEGITGMTKEMMDRHQKHGALYYDSRWKVTPEEIEEYRLSMVQYTGQGKYARNRLLFFDDLPDAESSVASIEDPEEREQLMQKLRASPTAGWWPVVCMLPKEETQKRLGLEDHGILATCFYQMLDRDMLVAWNI